MDQIICHPYFDATDKLDWLKKKKKRKEKKASGTVEALVAKA